MVNNSTQNVNVTKSGTGWTVDVTACNLLSDTTIKDFRVLFDGTLQGLSDFEKLDPNTIKYNGNSINSTNVEVRRVTPPDRVQEVQFASKFSSALWEAELNRQSRIGYELELNGALGGNTFTAPSIKDDAFGNGWASDTNNGASRNALYDVLISKVNDSNGNASGLTLSGTDGDNTAPTVALINENDIIATTSFVHSLIDNDLSNDPTLGDGSTLQITPSTSTINDQIATTQFVKDYIESANKVDETNGSASGLTLTSTSGDNTAPTVPLSNENNTIATTSFVHSLIDNDLANDPTLGDSSTLQISPSTSEISDQIATTQFVKEYIESANWGTISGTVTISGKITGNSGLDIDGGSTLSNGVTIDSGDLSLSSGRIVQNGTQSNSFDSEVFLNSSLDVDGGCTISGGLTIDSGTVQNTGAKPADAEDSGELATTEWVKDVHNTDDSFFFAYQSSNETISADGNGEFSPDTVVWNDGNNYGSSSGNYMIPYDGLYYFELGITFVNNGNSFARGLARIKTDGAKDGGGTKQSGAWRGDGRLDSSGNTDEQISKATIMHKFNKNDIVEAGYLVNLGSASSVDIQGGSSSPFATYFLGYCIRKEAVS